MRSIYTVSEVVDLLIKAKNLGLCLDKGSYLENLKLEELDKLVSYKQ